MLYCIAQSSVWLLDRFCHLSAPVHSPFPIKIWKHIAVCLTSAKLLPWLKHDPALQYNPLLLVNFFKSGLWNTVWKWNLNCNNVRDSNRWGCRAVFAGTGWDPTELVSQHYFWNGGIIFREINSVECRLSLWRFLICCVVSGISCSLIVPRLLIMGN